MRHATIQNTIQAIIGYGIGRNVVLADTRVSVDSTVSISHLWDFVAWLHGSAPAGRVDADRKPIPTGSHYRERSWVGMFVTSAIKQRLANATANTRRDYRHSGSNLRQRETQWQRLIGLFMCPMRACRG